MGTGRRTPERTSSMRLAMERQHLVTGSGMFLGEFLGAEQALPSRLMQRSRSQACSCSILPPRRGGSRHLISTSRAQPTDQATLSVFQDSSITLSSLSLVALSVVRKPSGRSVSLPSLIRSRTDGGLRPPKTSPRNEIALVPWVCEASTGHMRCEQKPLTSWLQSEGSN